MKIGLYSITYLGVWYRGEALALPDVIRQARELGYDGVEIDGKRPHGNPMDLSASARRELKAIAADEGIEIPCVASNNDCSSPVPEQWEAQLLMVREQIRLAADLGAPVVRLFFAWPGITYRFDGIAAYDVAFRRWDEAYRDTTRLELWNNAKRAFKETAHIAEQEGVTLALQNHAPLCRHHRDVLDMVSEVDSPAFKACVDAGLLRSQDDEWVRQVGLEVGKLQVQSHFSMEYQRNAAGEVEQRRYRWPEPTINYPAYVQALKECGYDGYFCFEFCHPALNARHEVQGREFVDEQAALALEYMRGVMTKAGAYHS